MELVNFNRDRIFDQRQYWQAEVLTFENFSSEI